MMPKESNEVKVAKLETKIDAIQKTLDELVKEVRGKWEHFGKRLGDLGTSYTNLSARVVAVEKEQETITEAVEENTKYRTSLQANTKMLKWFMGFIGVNNIIGVILFAIIGYLYITGQI